MVLPCAGGHRQLYGKKLTDMMSVFEAIDRYQTTATTTANNTATFAFLVELRLGRF